MSPIPNFEEENSLLKENGNLETGLDISEDENDRAHGDDEKVLMLECAEDCASGDKFSEKMQSMANFGMEGDRDVSLPRDMSSDTLSDARVTRSITQIASVDFEQCGLPLDIFSEVFYLYKKRLHPAIGSSGWNKSS